MATAIAPATVSDSWGKGDSDRGLAGLRVLVRGESLRGTAGHVRIRPTARALSRLGLRRRDSCGRAMRRGRTADHPVAFRTAPMSSNRDLGLPRGVPDAERRVNEQSALAHDDEPRRLHRRTERRHAVGLRRRRRSRPDERDVVGSTGALLVGRRTQDVEDRLQPGFYGGAFRGPFFVLRHDPPSKPPVVKGVTGRFLDVGIDEAVGIAKEAADGGDVVVLGANVARQCPGRATRRDHRARRPGPRRRRRPPLRTRWRRGGEARTDLVRGGGSDDSAALLGLTRQRGGAARGASCRCTAIPPRPAGCAR